MLVPRSTAGIARRISSAIRPEARDLRRRGSLVAAAIEIAHDLGEAEQAHGDRHEIDAVVEFGHAEGEARNAALGIGPDNPDQQSEQDHRHRLDHRAMREHDRGDQAEQHQREIFGRAELLGELRQDRCERRNQDRADAAGEERPERCDGERGAGAAALRHAVAVDAGHDGGGFARQVHQDRRGRAAVLGAVVDAGQHDQRAERAQAEGDRQQHRDGRDRADARKDADQRSDQATEQAEQKIERRGGDPEADRQIVKDFH